MSEQPNQERRRFTRVPMHKAVSLFSGLACYDSVLYDLSLKGALLKSPPEIEPKVGDLFRLSIPLEQAPAIIMNVQVVHCNGDTFGAEWTQIDMDSFASLKRTIEFNITEKERLRKDIKTLAE